MLRYKNFNKPIKINLDPYFILLKTNFDWFELFKEIVLTKRS